MGYYIDLTRISIDVLKERLKNNDLLPSQQILKEDIDERFRIIKFLKIKTVEELKQALKTKRDVSRFSAETTLPEDYLTVLRREINSLHPQPRKIKEFPCLSDKVRSKLENAGIRTTVELFDRIATKSGREVLRKETGINQEEILLLTKLTDLSRIRYVNQTFATLLVNSEYDTTEKIKKADYKELYKKLMEINTENNIFKGKIGVNDIKFLVKETKDISMDIVY
jgi:hypothetical protein